MPAPVDRDRWAVLSPLIDEWLDLPAGERAERLARLREQDPALADELAPWLQQMSGLDQSAFLQAPALPTPELAGQTVGAYQLTRELGRGGMGSVWLASRTDGRFDGEVAIKFLSTGLLSAAAAARFAREGSIMARLAHPHIARLLDAGQIVQAGLPQPYLVLEYVPGEPIDRHCEQRGLGLAERLQLFLDVLDAVSHAHNRLILHRDLKPSNILVTPGGEVKLLDFGIAKLLDEAQAGEALTQQAGNAYTLQYAAPEQLQGGEVSTATDVYALGVLLFRLLSGQLPLQGVAGHTLAQWQAVIEREPPRMSEALRQAGGSDAARRAQALRGDLDTIVARALKKLPAERYANASALADDLRRHLAHEPIAARADSWGYRSAKFLRRHRVGVAIGGLVALALASSTALALHEARQAQQQQAQAEGLIEFMLGDLPAKLKPVGRLDALDAVGDKALAYYAAQAPGSLDAASLGRRARALHLMGEITEQTGRLDEAARRFAEAEASTAELLARHPDDPQALFNHSQSAYWVGFIARRRGLLAEAETAFLRYQALAQQLSRLAPQQLDWRIETAYASNTLGVLQLDTGRTAPALQAFDDALQTWQALLAQRPALALELANTLGWISKAHETTPDYAAAVQAQRDKFAALAQAPDAARDRGVQELAALAHYDLGRLHLALGQADEALTSLREARRLLAQLTQLDPQNLDWAAHLGATLVGLAELRAGSPEGLALLAELQPLSARLLASPQRRLRWWQVHQGRWLILRAQAQLPGAVLALRAWLDDAAALEAGGQTLGPEPSRVAAAAGLVLGDLLGRSAEAQQAWTLAQRRLAPALARGDPPALALSARLAWRRGAIQEARQGAERLVSTPYRHPDVAALNGELSSGVVAHR